jgi:hypothetical protein
MEDIDGKDNVDGRGRGVQLNAPAAMTEGATSLTTSTRAAPSRYARDGDGRGATTLTPLAAPSDGGFLDADRLPAALEAIFL